MTETEVATESNGKTAMDNGQESSELDNAIIRQVEYYFGDLNMPRDKFMMEQVKLDEGWIPLDVLITFKRLANLTKDFDIIANAVKKSSSGLLEVSEDNKKIRRSPEVPLPELNEERRKELKERTLYVKGFPKDAVLDDLLKFFKNYDDVENVVMRKYMVKEPKTWHFKGSVFATFKTKEQAQKLLDTKDVKYQESELLVQWQEDYLKAKQEAYAARKDKKDKKPAKDEKEKEEKEKFTLPTGTVLHFSEGDDKLTREEITKALTPLGAEIAYIDFRQGEKEGWARLSKENLAKEVFEKITDAKIKIRDAEVVFRVLEGDEEKTYLDKTIEEMCKRRSNQHRSKKGNWHNKGRNQGGKKRKQGPHNDAPSSKVKAE